MSEEKGKLEFIEKFKDRYWTNGISKKLADNFLEELILTYDVLKESKPFTNKKLEERRILILEGIESGNQKKMDLLIENLLKVEKDE